MGYTHYYDVNGWNTLGWQRVWPRLVQDTRLILEAADVVICGPSEDENELEPPIVDEDEGIIFNGFLDEGHETFIVSEESHHESCKTSAKPYDVAVCCVLMRMYMLAPDNVVVCTDGKWHFSHWKRARELYKSIWPEDKLQCPWQFNDMSWEQIACRRPWKGASIKWDDIISNLSAIPRLPLLVDDNRDGALDLFVWLAAGLSTIVSKLHSAWSRPTRGQHGTTISNLDFTPVREWLSRCEEDDTHNSCRHSPSNLKALAGVEFRLIDVHRRCVVGASRNTPFIALTYVWGGAEQPKLTKTTEPLLLQDGGVDAIWALIPTTVKDAIVACEKMGERYLWTDSLCIMQDSPRDMKVQITWMRDIYAAAKCVLAAVSAENATVGMLEAVSTSDNTKSVKDENELFTLVEASPWSQRAWCYQEKVLSHRMVLFTSNGIYMQCQRHLYDINGVQMKNQMSTEEDKYNACGGMLTIPPGQDLEAFVSAVEYYSQRRLTKQSDKMNAFQGITRRFRGKMDGKHSSFLWGLPICAFDQTFCWRTKQHNPQSRNMDFPSWSWLGWNDVVVFDHGILQHARTNQMIYHNSKTHKSSDDDWEAMLKVRKPCSSAFFDNIALQDENFGFPSAQHGLFSTGHQRNLHASVARLYISPQAVESVGSNGRFAVYPTKCSQQPPPTPPKRITLGEALYMPMPKREYMDAETEAAPSIPSMSSELPDFDPAVHDDHDECEAHQSLGSIWLDSEWRKQRGDVCVMEFIALNGEKDEARPGYWTIKLLMLIQRMEKNGHFWARERVQVMDCEIEQKIWVQASDDDILCFNLV